jgi:hypothetical protein
VSLCVAAGCAAPPAPSPPVALAPPPAFILADGATNARANASATDAGSAPRALLSKEPDYKSAPVYFSLDLGNGRNRFITLALDESGGPGTGYDTLYVDANNDGDLTDYPPVKLEVRNQGPQFSQMTAPDPIPLTVRYDDGASRAIAARVNISVNRFNVNQRFWSLNCQPTQHVEGKVAFGDKQVLVGIYNASAPNLSGNWCFDNYGLDRLRIDTKGEGKLDRAEEMPLSRVIAFEGKLWDFEVNSAATRVSVKPCDLPSAPLAIAAAFNKDATLVDGKVELANHAGIALACRLGGGAPAIVPVGKYWIAAASMTLEDATNRRWDAESTCPRAVEVVPETGATVTFGRPLTLQVEVANAGPFVVAGETNLYKLGDQIRVSHSLAGPQGERYTSLGLQGERKPPDVRILDSEGIEVASGSMEYG